jgi:hypothetical protein
MKFILAYIIYDFPISNIILALTILHLTALDIVEG